MQKQIRVVRDPITKKPKKVYIEDTEFIPLKQCKSDKKSLCQWVCKELETTDNPKKLIKKIKQHMNGIL